MDNKNIIKNPRLVQNYLDIIVNTAKYLLFRKMGFKQRFTRLDISIFPYKWISSRYKRISGFL